MPIKINDTSYSSEGKPEGDLKVVEMWDGKPFFLRSDEDGSPIIMMNITKEQIEENMKVWQTLMDKEDI